MIITEDQSSDKVIGLLPEAWSYEIVGSVEEANAKLDTIIRFVLIHDSVLTSSIVRQGLNISLRNPATRIIIYLDKMNSMDILPLFNQGKIHRVIGLPNSDYLEIFTSAINEFDTLTRTTKTNELMFSRQIQRDSNILPQDQLLELSLKLADTKEIRDFTNQFVSMIDGIQSFISVNYSLYLDTRDEISKETIIGYLSDLELLANQYDQRILMMYVEIIRSYLYLSLDQIHDAMEHYKGCIRIFYWISNEYLDPKLISIIKAFPVREDDYHYIQSGEQEFNLTEELDKSIKDTLDTLLAYDIPKLTNISDTLYSNLKVDSKVVSAILVVRDSLPLFVFENAEEKVEPALIGGFVDALSTFLKELTEGKGDIDHIQHDKGVILIHKENNIRYLLVSSTDEVYLRIGLRQFAQETVEMFENIPINERVLDEEYILLKWKIEKLFKINKN